MKTQKKGAKRAPIFNLSDLEGSRTHNLRFRKPTLYPVELRSHLTTNITPYFMVFEIILS